MEETRIFIFEEILEKKGVLADCYIDLKWINLALTRAPIQVKKHFYEVLQQMIDEDFFVCKEGHGNTWFLTKKGEDALLAHITERNRQMNSSSSGVNINVNPVISPTFNQTNNQNQTQEVNVQFMLKKQLDEETYKKLEEIMKLSVSQEEKNSKLKSFFMDLSSGVVSNILANLITTLSWS